MGGGWGEGLVNVIFIVQLYKKPSPSHLALASGCSVAKFSSIACGAGITNVGSATLINGTGRHLKSVTCPENDNERRKWGWEPPR